MNKILFKVNNGGTLGIGQAAPDGAIYMSCIDSNSKIKSRKIPAGDMVMLLNWYCYVKDNDLQNDFANPYGTNKEV